MWTLGNAMPNTPLIYPFTIPYQANSAARECLNYLLFFFMTPLVCGAIGLLAAINEKPQTRAKPMAPFFVAVAAGL